MPFGGTKASGYGRFGGKAGIAAAAPAADAPVEPRLTYAFTTRIELAPPIEQD